MEPIAVVGLGCVFPGADSPEAFWANLVAGRDTTSSATSEDMGVDPALLYHPARGKRDCYSMLRGGFVRGFQLDPWGLRLSPSRLDALDPLFAWTLHAARAALADAAYVERDDVLARCGVILGNLCFPTRASSRLFAHVYAGAVEAGLSGHLGRDVGHLALPGAGEPSLENLRIVGQPAVVAAEALGLGGPSFAIDAACASSLYAIRIACDRLGSGETDLMLAGAVSGADPLFIHMGFSIFQAYPEQEENSRPLDLRSAGLLSGQGAGIVALRRYADALRDGDRIHAVIRGIGLSNDGSGKHLLVPNPKGQRLALERAYRDAGLSPSTVAYVECHATGTPIGDLTELDSMEAFFDQHAGGRAPLVGSVKSNFGHLLTASGIASVLKSTLALTHGLIPPTIGVEEPLVSSGGRIGGDDVVREATSWPDDWPRPRRVGVNAFGFGGTNAHLVLEEFGGAPVRTGRSSVLVRRDALRAAPAVAIVGMAAHFGGFGDLESLDRALYDGRADHRPPPDGRWNGIDGRPDLLSRFELPEAAPAGSYLESFDLDFLRARVPPDSTDRPIPQQLLLFDVADQAARDARLQPGANVAVVVAVEAEVALHRFRGRVDLEWQLPRLLEHLAVELSPAERAALTEEAKGALHDPAQVNQYVSFIGNVIACRVASRWDFDGPAFTVSAGELSAYRALELARDLLESGEVEAAVVGAVDLAGGLEAVLARSWTDVDGAARVGEGAGAIVLRRAADVEGMRAYAFLEGLSIRPPSSGVSDPEAPVAAAAAGALAAAGASAADIGYLELGWSGVAGRDGPEVRGPGARVRRRRAGRGSRGDVRRGVGDAHRWRHARRLGDSRADPRSALPLGAAPASVARASGRRQPVSVVVDLLARRPSRTPLAPPGAQATTRGCQRHRRRRRRRARGPRRGDAACAGREPPAPPLALPAAPRMRPDADALVRGLERLVEQLETGDQPFDDLVTARLDTLARDGELPARVVLVAGDAEQALQQARLALAGVPAARATGSPWETPLGSCFVPRPLGRAEGSIAFVYPGAFSAYPGLGDDLLQIFPALHEQLERRASDPADILGERRVRPRSRRLPDEASAEAAKTALREDAVAMIQAGTSYALATTAVLRDWFGISPASAFGYSMGEGSMLWALGVWQAGDEARRRLGAPPAVHHAARRPLRGRGRAGRRQLGLGRGVGSGRRARRADRRRAARLDDSRAHAARGRAGRRRRGRAASGRVARRRVVSGTRARRDPLRCDGCRARRPRRAAPPPGRRHAARPVLHRGGLRNHVDRVGAAGAERRRSDLLGGWTSCAWSSRCGRTAPGSSSSSAPAPPARAGSARSCQAATMRPCPSTAAARTTRVRSFAHSRGSRPSGSAPPRRAVPRRAGRAG